MNVQSPQVDRVDVPAAPPPGAAANAAARLAASIERMRRLGIVFGFVLVYLVFSLLNHEFFTASNLTAVAL